MKKKDPTSPARQKRLARNNAIKGLVKVKTWVPEEKREELLRQTARWRKKHKLEHGY